MATDFGTDTSCLDSLHTGRLSSGLQLVAEAAYRRLITPRGMLRGGEDEANYGLDLLDAIGGIASPSQAAAIPGQIEQELLKDQRIDTVSATVDATVDGPATSYKISIDVTTAEGPFSLVLSVDDVNLQILNLQVGTP